jgi:preprotein translocase subunit SecE
VGSIHYTGKQNSALGRTWGVQGMFKFLKNVSREMKKVSWPTGKELRNYTVIVLTTVILMALFFFIVDLGISQLFELF